MVCLDSTLCVDSQQKKVLPALSKVLQYYMLKGLSRHASSEIASKINSSLCASEAHTELPRICREIHTPKILIQALQVTFQQWVVCFKMEHLFSLKICQGFFFFPYQRQVFKALNSVIYITGQGAWKSMHCIKLISFKTVSTFCQVYICTGVREKSKRKRTLKLETFSDRGCAQNGFWKR